MVVIPEGLNCLELATSGLLTCCLDSCLVRHPFSIWNSACSRLADRDTQGCSMQLCVQLIAKAAGEVVVFTRLVTQILTPSSTLLTQAITRNGAAAAPAAQTHQAAALPRRLIVT